MKKVSVFFYLLFVLCFQIFSEVKIDFYDEGKYLDLKNSEDWSYSMQQSAYHYFFDKEDFNQLKTFFDFIFSLKKSARHTIDFSNPVIIAITISKYNRYLKDLYEVIPDAFLIQDYDGERYLEAPILYAVRSNVLDNVKIFFEKKIFSGLKDDMFGSFDKGGTRFNFAYNLLTFTENSKIQDYLISQGIESELIMSDSDYSLVASEGVYYNPGFKCKYLDTVTPHTKIFVEKITLYKKDGYQWAKIRYDKNKTGWIIVDFLQYPRSYYEAI